MERILIAEDSATQREGLRHILAQQGYQVVLAADGQEAWERFPEIRPTLVITDIVMPRRDGYSLCREIKQDARFAHVPVVLLTSLSDPKDVIAALECGADSFIGKPFSEDNLLSRVRGVIANRDLPLRDRGTQGIEISHGDRVHLIGAGRQQILDLLLSVYDVAMRRNQALVEAQSKLRKLNAELEQMVRDRTRKFEESNKALETFCYSVAHDLRAPLRSIQGYAAMLIENHSGGLDEDGRDYTARASAAAARMDKMIVDLLAYGRVSHAETEMQEVNLKAEVDKVVAELAHEITARRAKIALDVPALTVKTSRVLLAQILLNLTGNALKFVPPHTPPEVRIAARQTPRAIVIEVSDRGIGMDPAYLPKIFNVFEKLHTGSFPGTGIGLAIVKKAVDRLGGQLSVNSELGKGTEFRIEIPVP